MKQRKINFLQKSFRHFAMRLYERYNIFITFEEYLNLHIIPFKIESTIVSKETNFKSYMGWVKIKDRDVLVYKSPIGYKQITTALDLNLYIKRKVNEGIKTKNL